MTFSYNDYYYNLFVIPTILIIVSLVLLVSVVISINKRSRQRVIYSLSAIITISVLFFVGLYQLNIDLMVEDSTSTEEASGDIVKISEVLFPPKFYYMGSRVRPMIIEVDENVYYILTIGDFTLGDHVTVEYLPNSKIVLSIHSSNED